VALAVGNNKGSAVHKLLEQQLRRCFGGDASEDPRVRELVSAVDAAYRERDAERALLERKMALASDELIQRNLQLEHDLEAIKRLEMELRQAEKLRAVGQLASGIAHEINTPIQYLGDSLRFLSDSFRDLRELGERGRDLCRAVESGDGALGPLEEVRACAKRIDLDYLLEELPRAFEQTEEGVRRVASIVLAMKEFGRPDTREKTPVALKRCIENALVVAHNELKYAADLELDLADVPQVLGYPGELTQVFLNLLINAAHAIVDRHGSGGRGKIRVSALPDGEHVNVNICDDGAGIPAEIRARIFEPFFTTKALGRGTGQGLAIARSIVVDKHGGALAFESVVGEGTTFTIRLPVDGPPELGVAAAEVARA
jgi:signal transduction histidine kinase